MVGERRSSVAAGRLGGRGGPVCGRLPFRPDHRPQADPRGDGRAAPQGLARRTTQGLGQSAVVEQIKAQVAEIRGLGWEGRLPVHIVSRPELADRLHKAERSDAPERSASDGEILKLLGLIPQDLDYAAARKQLAEAQVVGFYDPDTQEIVVGRGEAALGPRALMAIAHELEHALVDQHFRFGRRLDALHKEGTTRRPSPCSPLWKETPGLSSTPGQTAT